VVASRETVSHNILAKNLKCKTLLVPDFVFYMKPKLTNKPRKGALLILRHDHETLHDNATRDAFRSAIAQVVPEVTVHDCNMYHTSISDDAREGIVNQVLDYIQGFQVVLTDRMHGMIFSAITGTPCVSVPDKIPHKSSGYKPLLSESIQFINRPDEVVEATEKALNAVPKIPDFNGYYEVLREWCLSES